MIKLNFDFYIDHLVWIGNNSVLYLPMIRIACWTYYVQKRSMSNCLWRRKCRCDHRWQKKLSAARFDFWCKFENLSCQRLSGARWGLGFLLPLASPVIIRERGAASLPLGSTPPLSGAPSLIPILTPCFQIARVLWSLGRQPSNGGIQRCSTPS